MEDYKVETDVSKEVRDEDRFIFGNLKDIQMITMFAAFSAVVITLIAMILIPERIDRNIIVYVLIGTSIFLLVYLSIPSIYLNPRYSWWTDLVFVTAITFNIYAFREFGDFYFILYIVLAAVDAFALRLRYFVAIIGYMLLSITIYNLYFAKLFFPANIVPVRAFLQAYSILITAVVMKFFATKALSEKEEKEKIRRLAENTLSAIKNLRTLIDNIGDGIFAVDEKGRVYTSNTAAINIIGWKKAIINRDVADILKLKDKEMEDVDAVSKVLQTGKPFKSSDLVIEKDGEEIKLYVNIAPIFGQGTNPTGAIIVFRDITKEKEMEEQRMEFVAVSSHELRTPLTIIEGYLYNLLNNKTLVYDAGTREFIEKAHMGAKNLQNLITDLLDVSKIENNRISFQKEKQDLREIAEEVVEELQKKAREANLKLELVSKNKRLPKVLADRARIKEVFVNLVTNAIKYSEKGKIIVSVEKDNNSVLVAVRDNGIGMSIEDQKFIFDKFYRAENWRTKKTSGTGLGLYITKAIIENHKGKIWTESKTGKGSVFYFSVPIIKEKKKADKEKEALKGKREKELGELVKKL